MTNTNKSTAISFAYWSLGLFAFSFVLCIVSQGIGGFGLLGSCLLGLIAFVPGLVEKNTKAWALGLITPVLFFALVVIGLAVGVR